jgi:hypothetical protein
MIVLLVREEFPQGIPQAGTAMCVCVCVVVVVVVVVIGYLCAQV